MNLKYEIEDHPEYFPSGTFRVGTILATFEELVAKFGEPVWTRYTRDDLPDSYCNWYILIEDLDEDTFHPVAIYDWCLDDRHPRDNGHWHVGGKSVRDFTLLMHILHGDKEA